MFTRSKIDKYHDEHCWFSITCLLMSTYLNIWLILVILNTFIMFKSVKYNTSILQNKKRCKKVIVTVSCGTISESGICTHYCVYPQAVKSSSSH